mmetsp:Transcript_24573/g.56686  ORF Transcript_24573/g.56686 Transcript_24573/m.56686 type:complete len:274 (-) Transcript_24573:184-1005(-)
MKLSSTSSFAMHCKVDSTFIASVANGKIIDSDGAPFGASCIACGPLKDDTGPDQKMALACNSSAISSDARERAWVASGLDEVSSPPPVTAATKSMSCWNACERAFSKDPSNAEGVGSESKISRPDSGTIASVPSSQWHSASPSVQNSTQHSLPLARCLQKPPFSSGDCNAFSSSAFSNKATSSDFSRQAEKSTPNADSIFLRLATDKELWSAALELPVVAALSGAAVQELALASTGATSSASSCRSNLSASSSSLTSFLAGVSVLRGAASCDS